MAHLFTVPDVDERTDQLDDTALYCRENGHRWFMAELTPAQIRRMIKTQGAIIEERTCANECGCGWTDTIAWPSFDTVSTKRTYPKSGYLLPAGSGRLRKREAKKTRYARRLK